MTEGHESGILVSLVFRVIEAGAKVVATHHPPLVSWSPEAVENFLGGKPSSSSG
jgi:hypothetical protein